MFSEEEINRRIQEQEAQWGGMQGGFGGMQGGMGGQQDFLKQLMELNPNHRGIQDYGLEQMLRQQDPYSQWEMSSTMQNDALQRAMMLTELASMFQGEGGLSPEGQQIMQMGLGGLGVDTGMSGYGAMGDVYQSVDADMMGQIQNAASRGDFETAQQIAQIRELAQQDPSVYEEWARKPSWGERLSSLGGGGAAQGAAFGGAGILGGAKAGALLGGKAGLIGGPKGALVGGALGGLAGGLYGLRGLWDDEGMRLGRDYSGYGQF